MNNRYIAATFHIFSGLALLATFVCGNAEAGPLRKDIDASQVLPLEKLDQRLRDSVIEVIQDNHFHRKGKPDTFPTTAHLYLSLLNEPALTLALWQDLNPTTARLTSIAPGIYEGTDGVGAKATWQFALRSPQLHVLHCNIEYDSPRGNARLEGRVVVIVRSGYFREVDGAPWVQHEVELFVRVDSRGWKTVAVTARPIIEKVLEQQIEEAGLFVSLMARIVQEYPNWAVGVASTQAQVPPQSQDAFRAIVTQARKPNALSGRPQLADQSETIRR